MNSFFAKHYSFYRVVEDKINKMILGEEDACDFFDAFGILVQLILLVLTISILLCKLL